MPPTATTTAIPRSLVDKLQHALRTGEPALSQVTDAEPCDDRDRLLTLQVIHDLHVGDIDQVGDAVRWQHHPAVATLKTRLEAEVLAELDAMADGATIDLDADAVAAIRAIARQDLVPEVYEWVAADAAWDELVSFLALEGGPDAGFDDLVAACQIGLRGEPKLELARNYWDEMGQGTLDDVHTELHHRLCEAIDMPRIPRDELPTSALLRTTLGGILATNRVLQPEMVGAARAARAPGRASLSPGGEGVRAPRRTRGGVRLLRRAPRRRSAPRQGVARQRHRPPRRRPSLGCRHGPGRPVASGRQRRVLH